MLKIRSKLLQIEDELRRNPKGFDLDDYYMCIICSKIVGSGKGWYDKFGPKCTVCQKAFEEQVFPPLVCLERTSWLTMWEVNQLGYHHRVIRMMMKQEKLRPRIIKDNSGEAYFFIFIKKENAALLTGENLT